MGSVAARFVTTARFVTKVRVGSLSHVLSLTRCDISCRHCTFLFHLATLVTKRAVVTKCAATESLQAEPRVHICLTPTKNKVIPTL